VKSRIWIHFKRVWICNTAFRGKNNKREKNRGKYKKKEERRKIRRKLKS
jgi:hypothetical protein